MKYSLCSILIALTLLQGCAITTMHQPRDLSSGEIYVSGEVDQLGRDSFTRVAGQAGVGVADSWELGLAGGLQLSDLWRASTPDIFYGGRAAKSFHLHERISLKMDLSYLYEQMTYVASFQPDASTSNIWFSSASAFVDATSHQAQAHAIASLHDRFAQPYLGLGILYRYQDASLKSWHSDMEPAHREVHLHRAFLSLVAGVQIYLLPERLAIQLEAVLRPNLYQSEEVQELPLSYDQFQTSMGVIVYFGG